MIGCPTCPHGLRAVLLSCLRERHTMQRILSFAGLSLFVFVGTAVGSARRIEPAPLAALQPALEVGTPLRPVQRGRTALIRLVYVLGMDKQSCPAIVCCGGRMDFHGALCGPTWERLAQTAKAGATAVVTERPMSWSIGDRIIVTATKRDYRGKEPYTEERVVKGFRDTPLGPATALEL